MTTFAERLKHAMDERHMSQSDLSAKSGISKAAISQYLSGKNQPKKDKIDRLADVLGASPDFLMGYGVVETESGLINPEKITVREAAKILGKSDQFIRIGLQRGILPFGWAVKTSSQWSYCINPVLFSQYLSTNIEADNEEDQLKDNFQSGNMVSVEQAAQLMGKSPQFIRLGLQQRVLPIGAAVKVNATAWDYYISPKLFTDFTGIEVQISSENQG